MCPACNKPMIVVEFDGVEVDYCADCHGVWLDTGELELISELAGGRTDPLEAPVADPLEAAVRDPGPTSRDKRRCPRCRRRLRVQPVGTRPPVDVDRCPAGHGLWFDAGELATVVGGGEPNAPVAEFLGQLFRQNTSQTEKS